MAYDYNIISCIHIQIYFGHAYLNYLFKIIKCVLITVKMHYSVSVHVSSGLHILQTLVPFLVKRSSEFTLRDVCSNFEKHLSVYAHIYW